MKKVDKKYFENPEKYIPKGFYCYEFMRKKGYLKNGLPLFKLVNRCPFLDFDPEKEEQNNGYCHFLEIGDWMPNSSGMLWDAIKECGINYYTDEELEEIIK
jgi:hypothetical protein